MFRTLNVLWSRNCADEGRLLVQLRSHAVTPPELGARYVRIPYAMRSGTRKVDMMPSRMNGLIRSSLSLCLSLDGCVGGVEVAGCVVFGDEAFRGFEEGGAVCRCRGEDMSLQLTPIFAYIPLSMLTGRGAPAATPLMLTWKCRLDHLIQ